MAANANSAKADSARADSLPRPIFSYAVFHFRRRSLLRANLLVLGSFGVSFWLSGFPRTRATPLLAIPAVLAFLGLIETVRCVQPRWDLYHFGILLLLLMDMLVLCLILFFLFFPYLV
jgi:hypothetical protein